MSQKQEFSVQNINNNKKKTNEEHPVEKKVKLTVGMGDPPTDQPFEDEECDALKKEVSCNVKQ